MDSFLRKWKLDPTTQKLEFVKEIQCHLASIKNVSMKGDLGIVATSARVILFEESLNKYVLNFRMGLAEFGMGIQWILK